MPTIIVIGASEGGVDAICSLANALPTSFPAAIFVVLHIGGHRSQLPALLNVSGKMRAVHAKDGELIRNSMIYVAPPDFHMVIDREHIRLARGPRENWARPAIDPLFRSAAEAYGADTIGVILTGGLNDGTAGLFEIKRCGGTTVVQNPDGAANPSMPSSALQHVEVDYCTALNDLPGLLISLVSKKVPAVQTDRLPMQREARSKEMTVDYTIENPVAVTCPDCGGALRRAELGTLTQFRCHIGHVYTAEVMVTAQFAALEWSTAATMRSLSERGEVCRQMAGKSRDAGDIDIAEDWTAAMHEAKERAGIMRELLEKEWTHPEINKSLQPSRA